MGETSLAPAVTPPTAPPRGRRRALAALIIFLLIVLAYVFGAGVILLRLPSHKFLTNAFVAYQSWIKRKEEIKKNHPNSSTASIDTTALLDKGPQKTCDGFTLFMSAPDNTTALVDMHGKVVHKWDTQFSHVFPPGQRPHVEGDVNDNVVCSFCGHMYPDGRLLVVFHGWGSKSALNGYGLAELGEDSSVNWRFAENIHHDIVVGEDDHNIYAIKHELVESIPGVEHLPSPAIVDSVVVLSADGNKKDELPILDMFRDSPRYSSLLGILDTPVLHGVQQPISDDPNGDVMHLNHVEPLPRRLADKFPMFKPGQLLISMRHLNIVAVIDPETRSVVWAGQGPWQAQHDPHFLDNGHILIFDNEGLWKTASRVLEFDPLTQSFPWVCSGYNKDVPFYTFERGMSQRFPNGNTLIVDTHSHLLLEVDENRDLVWRMKTPGDVNFAHRYNPEQAR